GPTSLETFLRSGFPDQVGDKKIGPDNQPAVGAKRRGTLRKHACDSIHTGWAFAVAWPSQKIPYSIPAKYRGAIQASEESFPSRFPIDRQRTPRRCRKN